VIRLIKRYPNRKLYDTVARRYVALRDIAALVREGIDLRVVEHETDKDITARTLSQVILQQQRPGGVRFSHTLLANLVRAGDWGAQTVRSSVTASWGILRWLDEEVQQQLTRWVARGLLSEATADQMRTTLQEIMQMAWSEQILQAEQRLPQVRERLNLASRQELQELATRIEELAQQIEELRMG